MTTEARARDIADFLIHSTCTNCQRLLRTGPERADLEWMLSQCLGPQPRACPEASDLPREERVVSTLAAAVLLVVGIVMGLGWAYLAGGIR